MAELGFELLSLSLGSWIWCDTPLPLGIPRAAFAAFETLPHPSNFIAIALPTPEDNAALCLSCYFLPPGRQLTDMTSFTLPDPLRPGGGGDSNF